MTVDRIVSALVMVVEELKFPDSGDLEGVEARVERLVRLAVREGATDDDVQRACELAGTPCEDFGGRLRRHVEARLGAARG